MAAGMAEAGLSNRLIWQERLETFIGLLVVCGLAVLVAIAILGHHKKKDSGYPLRASFSHIDGLEVGSDIRLAGVTIGHVIQTQIDPQTYQAQVVFSVAPTVRLPADSGAVITSDSLLGGKYIALTPGGDSKILHAGGMISDTQGAISLEQLLSKFIFAVTDSLQKKDKSGSSGGNTSAGLAP